MGEDYVSAVNYKTFLTKVLNQTPKEDHEIWEDAISGTEEEIAWIQIKLKERNIYLLRILNKLMMSLKNKKWLNDLLQTKKSYLCLLAVLYALELCNYEAWKLVKSTGYQKFVTRWTSEDVTEFIEDIKTQNR